MSKNVLQTFYELNSAIATWATIAGTILQIEIIVSTVPVLSPNLITSQVTASLLHNF